MTARFFAALVVCSLTAAGCCCQQTCGDPCGGPGCTTCCFSIPRPIEWNGCCNECGPDECTSCCECPPECGILPWLWRNRVCGQGCGEVYIGEWVSDPPDCCDPCDPCHGCWTGPQGCCNLGPMQRLLAALHGYSYCPPPNCGPVCGLCSHDCCDVAHAGYVDHGHAGCATCGGGHPHGADVYYDGPHHPHPHHPQGGVHEHGAPDPHILHENWNVPRTRPVPGKPIQKAQQLPQGQMTGPVKRIARPGILKTARTSQPIGSGVRTANYQR
jgi:hypothetical protein